MIVYHGGGYVGLTGAVHFALAGIPTTIYDPDPQVVKGIQAGIPRAGDFLEYLHADVARLVGEGVLSATPRFEDVRDCDTHIIAVPTEKGGKPDDALVKRVLKRLDAEAPAGALFICESTLMPGTVDALLPDLSGFNDIAVCPRRDWFADPTKNLRTLPRIVGGVTPEATARAVGTLRAVSDTILETDYRTAEIVKSLENALLHQQVMLVHQLAWVFPDRDIAEAVRLATTHWRLTPLFLGAGSGGRCVPLGSEYLLTSSHGKLGMAQAALEWDAAHRSILAGLCAKHGRRVLVLGAAYRPDFRDAGRSPGVDIARILHETGADVAIADPLWKLEDLGELAKVPATNAYKAAVYDVVFLATPHTEWRNLPFLVNWHRGQTLIDAQGAWRQYRGHFEAHGVKYIQVGQAGGTH